MQGPLEGGPAVSGVEEEAGDALSVVQEDKLTGVGIGAGDFYAVGFDGVGVLGLQGGAGEGG